MKQLHNRPHLVAVLEIFVLLYYMFFLLLGVTIRAF